MRVVERLARRRRSDGDGKARCENKKKKCAERSRCRARSRSPPLRPQNAERPCHGVDGWDPKGQQFVLPACLSRKEKALGLESHYSGKRARSPKVSHHDSAACEMGCFPTDAKDYPSQQPRHQSGCVSGWLAIWRTHDNGSYGQKVTQRKVGRWLVHASAVVTTGNIWATATPFCADTTGGWGVLLSNRYVDEMPPALRQQDANNISTHRNEGWLESLQLPVMFFPTPVKPVYDVTAMPHADHNRRGLA
ncbi:hypothetical protein VTK73DRAFT_657 [Phialemonium thermophilum]|uniref:Uncharacterized protein n=1 Tax=Phialemonium thermophilum TaxID=223376 RepID=A0ABR3VUJ2_9PEZI